MKSLSQTVRFALMLMSSGFFLLSGCGEDEALPVGITDLEPDRGAEGMQIKIKGNSFGNNLTDHTITFNGQAAVIDTVTNEQITVTVPPNVTTGPVVLSLGGSTYEGPTFTTLEEKVTLGGGFSMDAGIATIGSAFVYESQSQVGQTVLRLTPPKVRRVGIGYYGAKVPVINGFETSFDFQIHEAGPADQTEDRGSEGFAFIIQNQGINARGHLGASMAYAGIRNSLAIEFDVHQNRDGVASSFADPNGNHISVQTNTSDQYGETGVEIYHSLAHTSDETHPNLPELITSGAQKHSARIVYAPAPGTLEIYLNNELVLSLDLVLSDHVNTEDGRAYIGFTASTGREVGYASHDIINWSFEPKAP